jgi:sulfur carrier protein ThiS adenylyltransferase
MITIKLNGEKINTNNKFLFDFKENLNGILNKTSNKNSNNHVFILNGFQTTENIELKDNDELVIIEKGVMPDKNQLESMLSGRMTPGVYDKLKKAKVAVAGLGGLGSNIAISLARSGVGKLLLIDFDIVEPSNLNRQQYSIDDLGKYKTKSLKEQIAKINPFIEVEIKTKKINKDNILELFKGYDLVCEAFDNPKEKAMLINNLLKHFPAIKIVLASGMAGYGSANSIKTTRKMKNLYIAGDEITEAGFGNGLMAPRVMVCAAHQANMILRLILGIEEP